MSDEPSSSDDGDPQTDTGDRQPDADGGELTDSGTPEQDAAPRPPADSRWWYWVAAAPAFYVLATVVGILFGVLAFALALTGASGVQYGVGPGMGAPVGVGFFGVFLLFVFLFAVGGLLSLVFPVAIYLDADAVAETAGDWDPDPELYGVLGLVGIVAQPLQAPLGVYYLYKRHQSEGVP